MSIDIFVTKICTITFGFKYMSNYCIFGNFREGFISAKLHMRSFVKIECSRNGEITLSFTDIGTSCPGRDF